MGLVAGPWPGRPGAEFIGSWGCFQFAGRTMWACHQAASLPFQSSCPWSEGSLVFCNLLPGSQNFHKGTFVCGCQPNHCLCREMQTGDFLFHYLARVTPCLSFPRIDQTCQFCYSRLSISAWPVTVLKSLTIMMHLSISMIILIFIIFWSYISRCIKFKIIIVLMSHTFFPVKLPHYLWKDFVLILFVVFDCKKHMK